MVDRAPEGIASALPAEATGRAEVAVAEPRGRFSLLTRRDKLILAAMVGIPLLFDVALIWGPALFSVFLSFTDWDGLREIRVIGVLNYENLFTDYPFFWPAIAHNLMWLGFLMFVATPIGMFLAVLLDRELRGSRIYQTVFYLPVVLSLAVVGIIWTLQYAPEQGFINNALGRTRNDNLIDWLGNPNLNIWAGFNF